MLTIGQKLYFVPSYNGYAAYEMTVKKLGRKWAHCSARAYQTVRIDIETLHAHEDDATGRTYLSQAEYEQELAVQAAWRDLRLKVARRYSEPTGLTVEAIQQAKKLLFGDAQ